MRKLPGLRTLGLLAVVTALFVVPAAPASADGPVANAETRAATGRTVDASSALTACPVEAYGYRGTMICEFGWNYIEHPSGIEFFVIGTNFAVYHAWPGSGGWRSLGGRARAAEPNGVVVIANRTIGIIGTNGAPYCRDWPWSSGWYRC